jgi:hypothetical protein
MSIFGSILTGKVRNEIRDTAEGAAMYAAVESLGFYDGSSAKREAAEAVYDFMSGFTDNTHAKSQQSNLYWATLNNKHIHIPMAAAYAIAVYADPNELGINVESDQWKRRRKTFSILYPHIGDFLVKEGVKYRDYDKVLSCMSYFLDLHIRYFMATNANHSGY